MRNPITRLAAAAVLVVGMSLLIGLLTRTTTPAYGLDQTVTANQSLRSLHIKDFPAEHEDDPKEFWIVCDERGGIENVRYFLPAWESPQDGAKSVVWKQGVAKIWFPKKNCLLTYRNDTIPDWVSTLVRTIDPRWAVERLQEAQKQGKLTLEIEQPADKSQPIIVTATYLTDGVPNGRRDILHVDPTTKLALATEFCRLEQDGQYVCRGKQEYHDYDVPIDPAFFDLDAVVPADVRRVDGDALENRGLPQGSLRDDEIATEVVRQCFEALIAGNYEKVSQLCGGVPVERLKQGLGNRRFLRIVSIDKPTPRPDSAGGGLRVPCHIEMEQDGVKSLYEPAPIVRPTRRQSEHPRWEIVTGL